MRTPLVTLALIAGNSFLCACSPRGALSDRAAELKALHERCMNPGESGAGCTAWQQVVATCNERGNWPTDDCAELRSAMDVIEGDARRKFERSLGPLEARCRDGDAVACDSVRCMPAWLAETPAEKVRACADSRQLASGATWAQFDSDVSGSNFRATVLCYEVLDSFDEIGRPRLRRPNIRVRGKVRDGAHVAPYTVRIGGDASKYPREEFPGMDAAATFGCREAVRRITEEDKAAR